MHDLPGIVSADFRCVDLAQFVGQFETPVRTEIVLVEVIDGPRNVAAHWIERLADSAKSLRAAGIDEAHCRTIEMRAHERGVDRATLIGRRNTRRNDQRGFRGDCLVGLYPGVPTAV